MKEIIFNKRTTQFKYYLNNSHVEYFRGVLYTGNPSEVDK